MCSYTTPFYIQIREFFKELLEPQERVRIITMDMVVLCLLLAVAVLCRLLQEIMQMRLLALVPSGARSYTTYMYIRTNVATMNIKGNGKAFHRKIHGYANSNALNHNQHFAMNVNIHLARMAGSPCGSGNGDYGCECIVCRLN